jgi:hypothetical protein
MKWAGVWAASFAVLVSSGAPVVFADEVAGQVTASIDVDLGGSPRGDPGDPLAGQEDVCVATDCEPNRDPGYGR